MLHQDTIAALSSAADEAARMIVRVSGPFSLRIAQELCRVTDEPEASAFRARLHFSALVVPAWVYVFRAPGSYTGEDLVEFHIPGNPVLVRMLLDHLRGIGTRDAEPGEFTARAFFNGRLDLTEAEGVAATISARTEDELAAARQLMAGELARRLRPVTDEIFETLALVEVGIDFSDEDVTFLPPDRVRTRAADADAALKRLLADSSRFERLSQGPAAVLVGRPNAGKSTLLNALARSERAVASPSPGTTRDVLSAAVSLEHGMLRLLDVAGIEDVARPAADSIEGQMRLHALRAVEEADLLILVQEVTDKRDRPNVGRVPDLVVLTKIDLADRDVLSATDESILVSAVTGERLDDLRARLDHLTFGNRSTRPTLALNARHVAAVREAREALHRICDGKETSPEVIALELREALDALGRIVGAVMPDDLLGRIFSTFCIGK